MSVYCTLFSQTFYGLLFCYLTIADVHATLYLQIIDFQFPSCCTSQPPKNLNQIITVNSSTNIPRSYHQKNNSCTLCVPMLSACLIVTDSTMRFWFLRARLYLKRMHVPYLNTLITLSQHNKKRD